MQTLDAQDAQATLPGQLGTIATWSRVGDPCRSDIVELQDGRIIKIHRPTTASADRDCFAVSVIHAGYSRTHPMGCAALVLGGCGLMYRHRPTGAWELYPVERTVHRLQRGSASHHGIHADEQASARSAALQLLTLSDQLTRSCLDYVRDDQGHKVGRWRVKLLAAHADGVCQHKPTPNSVKIGTIGRQFLVTGPKDEACRIVVMPWDRWQGLRLETSLLAIHQPAGPEPVPVLPASVAKHCLSRCTL
jgi:hypothetical protein